MTTIRKPHVFVLIVSNGEEYDDYSEDIAGVFATLRSAKKAVPNFGFPERIEEWKGSLCLTIFPI